MLYEIDFFPVGDGEKSGDAISLRYSSDGIHWTIGVVDGGTQSSSEAMVEHIPKYYGSNKIDFVICTHPEQDHASGLLTILEELNVSHVLMHCPWDHIDQIYNFVTDGRVSTESLRKRLIEGHPYAYDLYEKAKHSDIPIYEPFSDKILLTLLFPNLRIIGPSKFYYIACLCNFRSITEATETILESIMRMSVELSKKASSAINWVKETWNDETLIEPAKDAVTSENNSGVISMFTFGEDNILLTADVGVPALNSAIEFASSHEISIGKFSLFQAPHHGSKRNLGPSILDRLLGIRREEGSQPEYNAIISTAKGNSSKHPSKRVVNALIRRGAMVFETNGKTICFPSKNMPSRERWQSVAPLSFYDQVEDD